MKKHLHILSGIIFLSLAILGAGCADTADTNNQTTEKKSESPQNLLGDSQVEEVDQEFTTGSTYMRETPQRIIDLKGKKPFFLYFYADWNKDMRLEHAALVQLFDKKKLGTPFLRVNYTDNQVTDEGVALAKNFSVTQAGTVIGFDASGKEVVRYTGPVDEAVLQGLQSKVLPK